jgi:hypothetical protein
MENFGFHLEPARAILYQVGAYLPRILIAILIVAGGWLLAKAARFAVTRGLRAINFRVLTDRAGLDAFLRQGGLVSDTTDIFGLLAYWLVILAALLVAFNGLGLSYVTALLSRLVWFLPNLFIALLILAFGAYFARFVGNTLTSYGQRHKLQDAALLGRAAQYAIVVFVVLIALDQLKVGGDIVRQSFLIILGGVVFAIALAFGLGGREWAAERIEGWWPRERKPTPGQPPATPAARRPGDPPLP